MQELARERGFLLPTFEPAEAPPIPAGDEPLEPGITGSWGLPGSADELAMRSEK